MGLIDREETIEMVRSVADDWMVSIQEGSYWAGFCLGTDIAIQTVSDIVPSAEKTGKWIPCKERLPKLGEEVWVTADGKSKIATLKERKTTFGDYIQEWWTEDDWIFQFEDVTAWQPLYRPQPYKGAEMVQDEN